MPNGQKYISDIPRESFDFRIFDNGDSHLKATPYFKYLGKEVCRSLGIQNIDNVVCLYIRDGSYGRKLLPNISQEYSNYRDSNIASYASAIHMLLDKGYTVIRMGRVMKDRLQIHHPNFIDYSFSNCQSDFADFYLTYICKFAICSDSGMVHLPLFLRRPIGLVNVAGLHGLLHTKYVKYINFKVTVDKNTEHKLSLINIFENGLDKLNSTQEFSQYGVQYFDCEEDEITALFNEMHLKSSQKEESIDALYQIDDDRLNQIVMKYRGIPMQAKVSPYWNAKYPHFLKF